MKKLSKLFLVLILVCSVLFSVACGTPSVSEIEQSLKDGGYTVTKTTGKSKYISEMYLSESVLKGSFTELIATDTGFLPDEDLNYKKIVGGNYVADEDGDYVFDATLNEGKGGYRLAKSDEDGNFSQDPNYYYPEEDGDYVYDETLSAYVLDADVNYFDVVDDAYYNDGTGAFVRNDSVDYIEDKGGRYVADKGGKFIYDAESAKIVEIVQGKFFEKKDEQYVAYEGEDTTGKYVQDAKVSSKKYLFDGVFYAFDKKGDFVFDVTLNDYVQDEDVNFACNVGGNYKEYTLGKYVYDRSLEQYVLDTDVNYVENGTIYVPDAKGTYYKSGDDYVVDLKPIAKAKYNTQLYDIDSTRYLKDGDNYVKDTKTRYYLDSASNYVSVKENYGNYIKDGGNYVEDTRVKYVKLGDDLYVKETDVEFCNSDGAVDTLGQRYAPVTDYVKVENRDDLQKAYFEFNAATGKYVPDKDKNFDFVADRYVPTATREPDAEGKVYKYDLADEYNNVYGFVVDSDVNYRKEADDTYVIDVNGDYKIEEIHIVVLVFDKKKDAKNIFNDLSNDFYSSKCYKNLFGNVKRDYIAARNGKIIYMGYVDYLDVLGDVRL